MNPILIRRLTVGEVVNVMPSFPAQDALSKGASVIKATPTPAPATPAKPAPKATPAVPSTPKPAASSPAPSPAPAPAPKPTRSLLDRAQPLLLPAAGVAFVAAGIVAARALGGSR